MITKDSRGITACTLATCCLTLREQIDPNKLKFVNEKGEELTCSKDEFKEIVNYMYREGILEHCADGT
jgi:hypothetical protein